ncbi:MAG TPA: dTMP kinase [Firmicutes bacterium]|nr:dTMP kinase [Bacillota bacterium]
MNYVHRGKLITFEGCEGVGKSTQIRLLEKYLSDRHIPCLFTREPGGTPVGERIRELLKDDGLEMYCETELLLFEAARLENTRRVIIPALEEGRIVVVDRYIDSTTAYQAFGRGVDRHTVDTLNRYGSAGVKIDLTLFLDAPPFANTSRAACDRMENAGADFHERVYEGYKAIGLGEERFVSVPTLEDKHATAARIINVLEERGIL